MNLSRLCIYFAALCLASPTWSAEFCIASGDVGALSAALITASNNGEDDSILLEPGFYALSTTTPRLGYWSAAPQNLVIEGGYTPFDGGGCGKLVQYGAEATVIDGAEGDQAISAVMLSGDAGSWIQLKFLKIQNVTNLNLQGQVAVLLGQFNASQDINIDLENIIFENNGSTHYYPIQIHSTQTIVRNSVFAKNQVFAGYNQIHIRAQTSGFCAAVLNSTIVGNAGGSYALGISAPAGCTPLIANTLFWGNSSGDLYVSAPSQSSVSLYNNDIGDFATSPGVIIDEHETLVSVDPLFVDASGGNYALSDFSLLRDKGANLEIIGGPGPLDVSAFARTYGAHPDIGAHEIQDVIFASALDQSLQ